MEMVRVNTRISHKANTWLDEQSSSSGVPKSTLILLAIENYIAQKESAGVSRDMAHLVERIDEMQRMIERKGLE